MEVLTKEKGRGKREEREQGTVSRGMSR